MSYQKDKETGTIWMQKIQDSNRQFEDWEFQFKCETLERYYEGFQWPEPYQDNYTLNMFFSTFQIKRPTLMFKKPIFFCDPTPADIAQYGSQCYVKANHATDLLNTVIQGNAVSFAKNIEMAILDAGPYFGVIEVGYDATWRENPNAGKPILKEDKTPVYDETGKILEEPPEVPESERIYWKRIPAHRFRTAPTDGFMLEQADWCGYYEFIRPTDLKSKAAEFRNIEQLSYNPNPTSTASIGFFSSKDSDQVIQNAGNKKVWKIWDNRAKLFRIIEDSGVVIYDRPFARLPLKFLKFANRRSGILPIPMFYNWKSPQDEYNHTRQQLKVMRERSKRLYTVLQGAIDTDEFDKALSAPEGGWVKIKKEAAVGAINPSTIDPAVAQSFAISKEDFNNASGTSAEMRGEASDASATATKISSQRSSIREVFEREIVAAWLCEIGQETLELAIERLTQTQAVKQTNSPYQWGMDLQPQQVPTYQLDVNTLQNFKFGLNITVESLSPVASEQDRDKWLGFITFVTQNQLISMHPDLIRETAAKFDYRNETIILALQQAAQLAMVGRISEAMPQNQTNAGQNQMERMEPPTMARIENQLRGQLQ